MEELEQYHKRYFDTKYGEVALTCCSLCGAVLWNPALHERAYHNDSEDSANQGGGTASEVDAALEAVAKLDTAAGFGESVGVGRSTATDRPVSSPPSRGTGRSTAAGQGRKGGR